MNTYQNLSFALERHQYKRGQYKGDAPADPSRRARSHIRIVKGAHTQTYNTCISICMYNTNILTAYPDGSIVINLGGWSDRPTTRETINNALHKYRRGLTYIYLSSRNVFGRSQLCAYIAGTTFVYYGGMTIDADGKLTSEHKPFMAHRIDKAETKELAGDVKASGLKDMFPLLYETCSPDGTGPSILPPRILRELLSESYNADRWSELIATFKYRRRHRHWGQPPIVAGDAKSCWSAIMKQAKSDRYITVASSTTSIAYGETPKFSPASTTNV